MKYKISKSDWEKIGNEMGWKKEAFGGKQIPKIKLLQREMAGLNDAINKIANISVLSEDKVLNEKITEAIRSLNIVQDALNPKSFMDRNNIF